MVNDEFDNMDIHFMKLAIGQAKKAAKINEVPIGCVIVYDGKIIGRGYNRRNTDKTTLGHAEITRQLKKQAVICRTGDLKAVHCM